MGAVLMFGLKKKKSSSQREMIFPTDEPFPHVWEERGLRKPPNLTSTESARRAAESASSITHIT